MAWGRGEREPSLRFLSLLIELDVQVSQKQKFRTSSLGWLLQARCHETNQDGMIPLRIRRLSTCPTHEFRSCACVSTMSSG